MLNLILLVFAFVCFVLAAVPLGAAWQPRLIAAGLAFWTASEIFGHGATIFGTR
jgi:hypothetical protein